MWVRASLDAGKYNPDIVPVLAFCWWRSPSSHVLSHSRGPPVLPSCPQKRCSRHHLHRQIGVEHSGKRPYFKRMLMFLVSRALDLRK